MSLTPHRSRLRDAFAQGLVRLRSALASWRGEEREDAPTEDGRRRSEARRRFWAEFHAGRRVAEKRRGT